MSRHESSHDRIRLGMVGLGGWGKNLLRAFAHTPRCEVSWLCDSRPETLAAAHANHRTSRATVVFEELLADDSLDAVAIATPPETHFAMADAALAAGKHVFVEKPMTLSAADAERLVDRADQVGRKLMVGHLLLYHPVVERMQQELARGTLGRLYYMYSQRLNLGVVRQHENAFWSLAAHDVAVMIHLLGEEPEHVTAAGECYLQRGIEDVVFANLHFPSGCMAQIHVSWLDPNKERRMVLVGSEKMLVFDDMQAAEKLRILDRGADPAPETVAAGQAIAVRHGDICIPHLPMVEPLAVEARHFVDCILEDRVPRSDGRSAVAVVRVLEQVEHELRARRSAARFLSPLRPHQPQDAFR